VLRKTNHLFNKFLAEHTDRNESCWEKILVVIYF
jgi:hypothetical protein